MNRLIKLFFTFILVVALAIPAAGTTSSAKGGGFGGAHVSVPAARGVSVPSSRGGSFSARPSATPKVSNGGTFKSASSSVNTASKGGVFTSRSTPSVTSVNHYYGSYSSGFGGFMGGFWGGMMYGSLWHPWGMYYPVTGAGMGYVQSPIEYVVLYAVIDLIILIVVCWLIYKTYKYFKRHDTEL